MRRGLGTFPGGARRECTNYPARNRNDSAAPHYRRTGGGGGAATRMGALHSRQVTTWPRWCSSTSMNLRHFGLGHCTAKTPSGADGDGVMAVPSHSMRSRRTNSASRAISWSERPLER